MECHKCGAQVDDSKTECDSCGESFASTKEPINDANNTVQFDHNELDKTEQTVDIEAGSHSQETSTKIKTKRSVSKTDIDQGLYGRRKSCLTIDDILPNLQKQVLIRIVSSFLKYTAGMDVEALKKSIEENKEHLTSFQKIKESLDRLDSIRDKRILKDLILLDILAQKENYKIETNELHKEVEQIEHEVINCAKNMTLKDYARNDTHRYRDLDIYFTVLEVAWRNDNSISPDEEALLTELRNKLNISIHDHRFMEIKLEKYPKHSNKFHSREEIDKFRIELQKEGLLWVYRENGTEFNVVPFEIMTAIRKTYEIELQRVNYMRLLMSKPVWKSHLMDILKAEGLCCYGSKEELINTVIESRITPSRIIDKLGGNFAKDMCISLNIKISGTKEERTNRIIEFFDDLSFEYQKDNDEREVYYHNFELLAARKYSDLMAKGIIKKQEEVERYFEEATDYMFEKKMNVDIEKGLSGNNPDGIIYLQNGRAVLWDNKSSETAVNLKDHLETQFNQYIRKEENKGKRLFFFLVIAPVFTEQSEKAARLYKTETNHDIALIEAKTLKSVADDWKKQQDDKPFPLGVLNKAGLISEKEINELLSSM